MRSFALLLVLSSLGCGVKGPPLPPLVETPQTEDSAEATGPGLRPPKARPSASPKKAGE